jgi:uracil-DNA glycosylase family 4
MPQLDPPHDCALCPRLVAYRMSQRALHPDWFNAPVPVFGGSDAALLIAGLAPGVAGANRTGRPFTGDYAGDLLYDTLIRFGFAEGVFRADPGDGLKLKEAMIVNAVRCVPPQNKPLPAEIKACNNFLRARIDGLPRLKAIVALGRIAHDSVLTALALKKSAFPFGHGAEHRLTNLTLFDSYHCSRYNTNTGVLTPEMFRSVFARARAFLDGGGQEAGDGRQNS